MVGHVISKKYKRSHMQGVWEEKKEEEGLLDLVEKDYECINYSQWLGHIHYYFAYSYSYIL